MIGVIANPLDHAVVAEYFELFKTPWELYRNDRQYEVLLCAGQEISAQRGTKLTLIFSGHELRYDTAEQIQIASCTTGRTLLYQGARVPIYGDTVTFQEIGTGVLLDEESQQAAIWQKLSIGGAAVKRVGYDLFKEIRTLLTAGQPPANASIPTLDLHIALLRDLIVEAGASLIEIPPVPDGYRFIACLTHDVDHPSIRRHQFDHTMFGFLYRAVPGSLFDWFRGRRSGRELLTNWWAACKLPFVYLGWANDFWLEFDHYAKLEDGRRSSFFVIPFKGRAGRKRQGLAPSYRASRYGAADIAPQLKRLMSAGCEIGLHGIDAWLDSSGRDELEEIRSLTKAREIGVRMHWLYFDEHSPVALERAGADYDSTVGYNETVGFRAGTAQVYKPLEANTLLELPMHIMDTALFYPNYLNLSPAAARQQVKPVVTHAAQYGGAVTVNWHDRSIAPERLWGSFYVELIDELEKQGAWFATANEAVSWFRKRRSAAFEIVDESGVPKVKVPDGAGANLPGLCSRIHHSQDAHQFGVIAVAP